MLQKPLNRRQMLKAILAAGGGITAASFLPAKWLKPVVESGMLPAHAAASIAPASCVTPYTFNSFYFPLYPSTQTTDPHDPPDVYVTIPPPAPDGTVVQYKILSYTGDWTLTGHNITGIGTTTAGTATFTGWYTYDKKPTISPITFTIRFTIENCSRTQTFQIGAPWHR